MRINRFKTLFKYLAIWLLVGGAGLYFRLFPLVYHVDSDSYEKATILTIYRLRYEATQQIQTKFPALPELQKAKLTKENFDKLLHEKNKEIKQTIDKIAQKISQAQTQKPPHYLLEADPYNYYGLTRNIVRSGQISDTMIKSKYLNKLMLAPLGHLEPFSLHPFVGYYLYRFLQFFNTDIDLMYAVSFTPLLIAALSLIPFLALCYILEYPLWTTFVGAIFFFLSPHFLRRSAFGWYDNDPYNTFFPLVILTILFLGLKKIDENKKILTLSILAAVLITAYALFWQGWIFLWGLIFIIGIFIIPYQMVVLKKISKIRNLVVYFSIILVGSFIGIAVNFGIDDFFTIFREGYQALKNFTTPQLNLWPNIFIGVGELRRLPLAETIELNGNAFFFTTAILGLTAWFVKALRSKQKTDHFIWIILLTTFVSLLILNLSAQRFALLFLLPLSLAFPFGLQTLSDLSKIFIFEKISLGRHQNMICQAFGMIFILLFIAIQIRGANDTMLGWRPIFNATWEKSLLNIKYNTPENSIVSTWWPPGHFITAMAERRVTFDGATINNPQAYWMAYLLLTDSEKEAAGLLRMLDNCANQATEYLQSLGLDLSLAVQELKEIVKLSRKDAQELLKNTSPLNDQQIETLLGMTHRRAPPSYLLIYNELVDKNLELSFIGRWDFAKIEKVRNNKSLLASVPFNDQRKFVRYLWDLIGGPTRFSPTLSQLTKKGNIVFFEQGVAIDLKNMTCEVSSKEYGRGIPKNIFYLEDEQIKEKRLTDSSLTYSVLLLKDGNLYNCILLDELLAKSLLIKLYFFKGKGLNYFKPFSKDADLTKRTQIYVYQVDWNKFENDLESKPLSHPPANPQDSSP